MALEPHDTVGGARGNARLSGPAGPPHLLQHPPGPGPAFEPVSGAEPLAAAHRRWQDAHDQPQRGSAPDQSSGSRPRRVVDEAKSLLKHRLSAAVGDELTRAEQTDRALIGDLVRTVELLAGRVDEIGRRLHALEALVEEVVVVTSEDLTVLRAAVARSASSEAADDDG